MDLILPIIFTIAPIDGSSYRVIDSPILQQFLSDVSQCLSHNAEKNYSWAKTTKYNKMNIVVILCMWWDWLEI